MKDFEENSFLGESIKAWKKKNEKKHKALFDCVKKLNIDCHKFLDNHSQKLDDHKKIVSFVLFIRILELFQGLVIVAKHGIKSSNHITFRAFIEACFQFLAIQKDKDYLDQYVDQFQLIRKKLYHKVHSTDSGVLDKIRIELDEDTKKDIYEKIKKLGVKPISVEEVAKKAGSHDIYLVVYTILSLETHSHIQTLDRFVEIDDTTQDILGFKYGPSDIDIIKNLSLSGLWLAEILNDIAKLLNVDIDEICNLHRDAFKQFLEH